MEAFPLLVRKRIIELYQQDKKTKEIAELFGTSRSGTRRIRQRHRETGSLAPRSGKRGRKPKLTAELEQQIRDHVAAHPDSTREQLIHALNLQVPPQTISRWLKKMGLPLKKSRCTLPSRIDPTSRPLARSGTGT